MSVSWHQILRGNYFDVERPDEVRAAELSLRAILSRPAMGSSEVVAELEGRLTMDGLLSDRLLSGSLHLRALPSPKATYDLHLSPQPNDPRVLTLRASVRPRLIYPLGSLMRLWGSLEEDGEGIALLRLRFDVRRDLIELLYSLRVL